MARHPRVFQKLQKLLAEVIPGGDAAWNYDAVKKVAYLDWIIHESLRLRPTVPIGLQRITPPQGIQLDEMFIPGNVMVSVPCYTIQRDGRYWDRPTEFLPERWEGRDPNKGANIPFSRGQMGCVGKGLAMMELRMVFSRVAMRFEKIEFEKGWGVEAFERETLDTFTTSLPRCPMVFTPVAK
jgi:cytochrome P450